MPFLCYVLQVHDCFISIMGILYFTKESIHCTWTHIKEIWVGLKSTWCGLLQQKDGTCTLEPSSLLSGMLLIQLAGISLYVAVGLEEHQLPPFCPSVFPPPSRGKYSPYFGHFRLYLAWAWAILIPWWLGIWNIINMLSFSCQLYNATLNSFLGASYCLSAGFELLNLLGMIVVYWYISGTEKKYGPLGERQEKEERKEEN